MTFLLPWKRRRSVAQIWIDKFRTQIRNKLQHWHRLVPKLISKPKVRGLLYLFVFILQSSGASVMLPLALCATKFDIGRGILQRPSAIAVDFSPMFWHAVLNFWLIIQRYICSLFHHLKPTALACFSIQHLIMSIFIMTLYGSCCLPGKCLLLI